MRSATLAVLTAVAFFSSSAMAQAPLPPRNDVRVNVNVNMSQPVSASDRGSLASLQTNARKKIYETAGDECKLLLSTIASECRLESLNVTSNVQNQFYRGDSSNIFLTTNSSAVFKIRLKD